MSLRVRLIGAFALVLAALAGLGAWDAWRLWQMGAVSNRIIADNFDSVIAAQEMQESLARQDAAILFLLAGERDRASQQLQQYQSRFSDALARASQNVTEPGEADLVGAISRGFADYSRVLDDVMRAAPPGGALTQRYFAEAAPRFTSLRTECDRLLTLNQNAMRRKAAEAAAISRRYFATALSLAGVLTFTGIVIATVMVSSLLRPINRLTAAAVAVAGGDLEVAVPATGGREIARLASAFNDMAGRLREVRDSNLGELMRARQVLLESVNQLRELDRLKSAFVAAAAHELRTPLMSFQMGIHLLLEDHDNLTERQLELLHLCREDSARLVKLSTDLLDLSKIESGESPPRLAPLPVARLLADAVDPLRLQAETHGIALTLDVDGGLPEVNADRVQIERVIANLVTNAVRATPSGGRITVRAQLVGPRVEISVGDTGHGIPAEYLQRIFVPFIQVPGPPSGGAGLGLSISRRIVEAHGGRLEVTSTEGRGTTFSFTLPLSTAQSSERVQEHERARSQQRMP